MLNSSNDPVERAGERFGETLMSEFERLRTKTMVVKSVDENNAYCIIYEDDEPLPVPLSFLKMDGAYFKVTPTLESMVGVTFLNGDDNTPVFISFTSVDRVEFVRSKTSISLTIDPNDETKDDVTLTMDTTTVNVTGTSLTSKVGNSSVEMTTDMIKALNGASSVEMTSDLIKMNGGSLDGLVAINALTQRLNTLQSELQTAMNIINAHTHNFTWAGTSGTSVTTAPLSQVTPPTTFSKDQYENTKITQ